MDTRIAFFGGATNDEAILAVIKLAAAGFDVVVASHDPREAPRLRDAGIPFVSSRSEALVGTQVVITSLRTPAAVEELYLGENGLLELMDPGTYAIDVSFSTPRLAREIQAVAAVSDIEVLDAPIVNLGDKEQSIMFVGGVKETQEALAPMFPYMASTIQLQSDAGEGQFAAVVAYIALAGSLMGAIEAMSMAHIAGYPENAALSVLASTSGGSRAMVEYVPRMLANDYSGNIKVADFLDALDVALDAADSLDVTIPMVETAYQLYDLLALVGGEGLNIQALALLYEDEQTCANYGLDWSLADTADAADGFGFDFDEPFDFGPDDDDRRMRGDDFNGRPPRGYRGGHGGMPPIDGFFSRN